MSFYDQLILVLILLFLSLLLVQLLGFHFFIKPFFQLTIPIYKQKIENTSLNVLRNMPTKFLGKYLKIKVLNQDTLLFRSRDFLSKNSYKIAGKVVIKDASLQLIIFFSIFDIFLSLFFISCLISVPYAISRLVDVFLIGIDKAIWDNFPDILLVLFPVTLLIFAKLKYNETERVIKELTDILLQYHR